MITNFPHNLRQRCCKLPSIAYLTLIPPPNTPPQKGRLPMPQPNKLSADQLRKSCDPHQLDFKTTAELNGPAEAAGQERAAEAITLSLGIRRHGFNLFALGPGGTGKQTALMHHLETRAPKEPVPRDWCYVNNFRSPRNPRALSLPAGRGRELSEEMERLVEALFTIIPTAFSSEEYQARDKEIHDSFQEQQATAIGELEKRAAENRIALIRTPGGFAFAPVRKGEVLKSEEFLQLDKKEQERIGQEIERLKEALQSIMAQIPKWQRETQEKLKELNRSVASYAIKPLCAELRARFSDLDEVAGYLDEAEKEIIEHFEEFLDKEEEGAEMLFGHSSRTLRRKAHLTRYKVNVIVDNSRTTGAPVIYEDKPATRNIIGDVEHLSQMGTLVTDFTLIRPGALHKANGGYLLIDARRLLLEPMAWESLKNALRTRQIRIESLGQLYSLISTVSLEPEPIPLQIKVVLFGERELYYLLSLYDPDFGELFKIAADFEDEIPADEEGCRSYARVIAAIANRDRLLHFDRGAVARIIEEGGRLAGDTKKLSAHLQSLSDLVHEADYHAVTAKRAIVTAADVQQAIEARIRRASRIREKIRQATLRHTILIDTEGEAIGQVNGLAVYAPGRESFGHPGRITASIRLGKGEVVDIEREVKMGGPIHSKGVLILAGFIGARFGMRQPLSLSASLVFEQSYQGVEGDSASSAELYALLSALAGTPIRQSLAVTGSINQHGAVQAIGGVNEKIEGFFDLCRERGLNGQHGVLIPAANVEHLMLRHDLVDAVRNGLFSLYPVSHVDEGIELLTGTAAGEADQNGDYPAESVNGRIAQQLARMAETLRNFTKPREET